MSTLVTRLKRRLLTRESGLFMALLLVAVAIRLPLMTFHGYYADLATYIKWGGIVNQRFFDIYTTSTGSGAVGSGFPGAGNGGFPGGPGGGNGGFPGGAGALNGYVNYPPGTPYLFGALVFVYNHLLAPVFKTSLDALVNTNGMGPLLAKIPLLLADLASIVVLYREARKRHSERFALLAAGSFAFSSALLYNGAIWGQTDGLVALPVLVALFAVHSERYVVGGVSLAVAVLLKPQPVIFVPLILLYLWRWSGRQAFVKFSVAGLATALVFLTPILVPHFQLGAMLSNMQAESYNDSLSLTSNAFNFWWLIGYSQASIGTAILGLKAGMLGDILFGAVAVVCGLQIWRHREPIYLFFGLALELFGFFFFMGGQHERYLFIFIPLALAGILVAQGEIRQHLVALYALGTILCLLNMMVGVGGSFSSSEVIPYLTLPWLSDTLSAGFDSWALLLAFMTLALFIYALRLYLDGMDRVQPVEVVPARSAEHPPLPVARL